jgi:hypothetical protein
MTDAKLYGAMDVQLSSARESDINGSSGPTKLAKNGKKSMSLQGKQLLITSH